MKRAGTITLELRAEDAEPILRQAAIDAAKFGGYLDHVTRRTVDAPQITGESLDAARERWLARFLESKRIVEAFGMDVEATTEEETLSTYVPDRVTKSRLVNVAGMTFRRVDASVPDPKNARPRYAGGIHAEACRQAADRVVRRWKESLTRMCDRVA